MEAFQIKHISNFIILRFLTNSDGKFFKGMEALSTTLLDGRNWNGYVENLKT
jgi:hypothetical protein